MALGLAQSQASLNLYLVVAELEGLDWYQERQCCKDDVLGGWGGGAMASGETQVSEFSFVLASRARRLGLVLKEASIIALYNFKYNF